MAFLQEYTLLDELGKGGFASVYKVRHNELGYIRAVRVLNETIVDNTSRTYQKFLRECKVLLRLGNGNHPNIVHIYQPRLLDNKALVEMDYVDGQDLLHYLKQNKYFVPLEDVIQMATQISNALAYCHEDIYRFCMDRDIDYLKDDPNDGSKVLLDDVTRKKLIDRYKVIHNDIHSGNIMRREDGNFVLLDFGLAINGDEVVRSSRHTNGAPEFKAPEKWENESTLSEQSDIYSFGIVLFQYLAGKVPFPYDNMKSNKIEAEYELSKAHKNAQLPSIEMLRKDFFEKKYDGKDYKKDYPQWLEEMILKCLEKEPTNRFQNGKELYEFICQHSLPINDEKVKYLSVENKELMRQIEGMRDAYHTQDALLNDKQKENIELSKTLQISKSRLKRIRIILFLLVPLTICGIGLSVHNMKHHFKRNPQLSVQEISSSQKKSIPKASMITAEVAKLKRIIEEKQEEITKLNEQIKKLQKDSSFSRREAILKKQVKEKQTLINQLNQDISTLKSDLEKANNEISVLRKYVIN